MRIVEWEGYFGKQNNSKTLATKWYSRKQAAQKAPYFYKWDKAMLEWAEIAYG